MTPPDSTPEKERAANVDLLCPENDTHYAPGPVCRSCGLPRDGHTLRSPEAPDRGPLWKPEDLPIPQPESLSQGEREAMLHRRSFLEGWFAARVTEDTVYEHGMREAEEAWRLAFGDSPGYVAPDLNRIVDVLTRVDRLLSVRMNDAAGQEALADFDALLHDLKGEGS